MADNSNLHFNLADLSAIQDAVSNSSDLSNQRRISLLDKIDSLMAAQLQSLHAISVLTYVDGEPAYYSIIAKHDRALFAAGVTEIDALRALRAKTGKPVEIIGRDNVNVETKGALEAVENLVDAADRALGRGAYADDADLAEAAEGETCSACKRPSIDCSREPCPAVVRDRTGIPSAYNDDAGNGFLLRRYSSGAVVKITGADGHGMPDEDDWFIGVYSSEAEPEPFTYYHSEMRPFSDEQADDAPSLLEELRNMETCAESVVHRG